MKSALASATRLVPGLTLPVIDLDHLIAIKLYSWDGQAPGAKPVRDIAALLTANPSTDLERLRATCASLGLGRELDAFLRLRGP